MFVSTGSSFLTLPGGEDSFALGIAAAFVTTHNGPLCQTLKFHWMPRAQAEVKK